MQGWLRLVLLHSIKYTMFSVLQSICSNIFHILFGPLICLPSFTKGKPGHCFPHFLTPQSFLSEYGFNVGGSLALIIISLFRL